jgi:hypothetical protein
MPEDESPKSKFLWALGQVAGGVADAYLGTKNLPQLAGPAVAVAQGTVSIARVVSSVNEEEAIDVARRTLAATPGAGRELARLVEDVEELQRRITLLLRLANEAGRHPSRELRQAIGRFMARALAEKLDEVDAFEMADVLSRMTSLDLAGLEVIRGSGSSSMKSIHRQLQAKVPGTDDARAQRVTNRLITFGLFSTKGAGGLTPLAVELMRRIADPNGGE